ncbi:hypothetical protein QR680_000130 [Steinernema hermaphroditum]|uniref:Secreted protein n=1 Tax=Steinernema hermaphroditum TaxID=289476 RepID=A0AA39GTH5_9BILA|nr:hypothetical protein QR680_000130 [Steinernema hermaphroditum]
MNSKIVFAFFTLLLVSASVVPVQGSVDGNTQIRLCGIKLIRFLEHTCDHKYVRKPKVPVQGGLAFQSREGTRLPFEFLPTLSMSSQPSQWPRHQSSSSSSFLIPVILPICFSRPSLPSPSHSEAEAANCKVRGKRYYHHIVYSILRP